MINLKTTVLVVGLVAALGGAAVTIQSFNAWADKVIVTEEEVIEIDNASMFQHMLEQKEMPYAMKSDIDDIKDFMLHEQIDDAKAEVVDLEDKEDLEGLSAKEQRQLSRKREYVAAKESQDRAHND